MPTMQDTVSVAANSVSANVMAGQLYEFPAPGTPIRIAALGAATGIRCTMISAVPIINDQAINFNATSQFPIIPDNVVGTFRHRGGRLVLTFRNTTGGAIVTGWRVDVA